VGFAKAGNHYEKDPDRRVQEAITLVLTCPPTFSQGKLESLADWM
jgi:hypothetical protein